MDALEAQSSVPEVDRDRWRYELDEASPPDGDAGAAEVAPAPGVNSLPQLALPHNDGDAVEAIRSIVGCPDRPYKE